MLVALASPAIAGGKGIGRTTEKELNVVLSASFGKVIVEKGPAEQIFSSERSDDKESPHEFVTEYNIRNRTGYLEISLGEATRDKEKRKGIHFDVGGEWTMKFSDALPVSFDIELGVAKGVIDLSGLQVKDFNMSCGASDVVIIFDSPNPIAMDEMTIESGVSKFEGRKLGNANFKHFRFQGGVGAATLDFSGAYKDETIEGDIEVGLGVCTIILPNDIGAKVLNEESLVSRISLAKDIRSSGEGEYVSDNFKNAHARIILNVSAGLGSVKVKRK